MRRLCRPNQLWQTDLFTFLLKRQNRRLYLVAFLDDHSRFIVGYGLHARRCVVKETAKTASSASMRRTPLAAAFPVISSPAKRQAAAISRGRGTVPIFGQQRAASGAKMGLSPSRDTQVVCLLLDPLKRPKQVDRGGPAGGQVVGDLVQAAEESRFVPVEHGLQAQAHAVGGRDADGRRPAHAEHADRLADGLDVAALDLGTLQRQEGLIDQPQVAVDPADPAQCFDILHSHLPIDDFLMRRHADLTPFLRRTLYTYSRRVATEVLAMTVVSLVVVLGGLSLTVALLGLYDRL